MSPSWTTPSGATDPRADEPHSAGTAPDGTPGPESAEGLPPGAGRFRVVGRIARGGMGEVLRGYDPALGRDLAVKVLLDRHRGHDDFERRFLAEARVCGGLQHPGVVPVYEVGRLDDRRPFFAMKLVRGHTLDDLLGARRDPSDDLPRFLDVFGQISQAVAYAHSQGVVHRDLKPANVMVGDFGEVQVMDWGLAKVLRGPEEGPGPEEGARAPDGAVSLAGLALGTPAYMAPEQARGEPVDARADVFGLGAVLCVVLTGRPPYASSDPQDLLARAARADLADAFDRLDKSGADEELLALAWACLDPEPDRRPRDAGEVARELTAYRDGVRRRLRDAELARAAAEARASGERRARRLTATLAAAGLVVLALLLLLGGGWAWRERERGEEARARAEQADRVAREVEADLARSADFRRRAEAADPDDPRDAMAAWAGALAAAREAAGRLAAAPDAGDWLHGRAAETVAALEQGRRDRELLYRLEAVRLAQTEVKDDGAFDPGEAPRAYAAAFRGYGIDVPALPPDDAAGLVRRSAVADEVGVALDDWAQLARDPAERERVAGVARRLDPDPGSWRNRLRDAVARRDRAALEKLSRSAEADALPPAATYLLGKALEECGAYAEGVALLRRAQRRHPSDFWVNHRLAFQLLRLRPPRADEAVRYFTAALALRPRSPGAHYSLGDALLERGAAEEAVPPLREAVRLKPDLALAHFDLGNALTRLSDFAGAGASYREAVRLRPGYPEAHNNLGNNLLELHRPAEALAEYREALRLRPVHPNAGINSGFAAYELRRFDDALSAARDAVASHPDAFRGHYLLGITLREQGNDDAALDVVKRAVRLEPKFVYARPVLAQMLLDRGRPTEALEELRAAIRLLPSYAEAYREAGRAHERLGQATAAAAAFREAVRIRPVLADAHLALGELLLVRGEVSAARAAWADALRVSEAKFAAEPAAADDLWSRPRTVAAGAAVRLGTGSGAAAASAGEAAGLRRRALDWLRADLSRWAPLASGNAADRRAAAKWLAAWRDDPALEGVRGDALAALPEGERGAWRRLWDDAEALRRRAAGE